MKFKLSQRSQLIARSLAILAGTGAIVVGATMAATTSAGTAALTANTFSVGTGGVTIAADNSGTAGNFGSSSAGFNFGSLTAGGAASAQEHFWLQNSTAAALALTATATDVATSNIDPAKVLVHIQKHGTTDQNAATLSSLNTAAETLSNPPAAGANTEYDIWLTLDTGALTGGTTATGSFGLDFAGTTTP